MGVEINVDGLVLPPRAQDRHRQAVRPELDVLDRLPVGWAYRASMVDGMWSVWVQCDAKPYSRSVAGRLSDAVDMAVATLPADVRREVGR